MIDRPRLLCLSLLPLPIERLRGAHRRFSTPAVHSPRSPRSVGSRRHTAGMTLLEITIALLLVVVLASYALPTYREYAARGHRQLAIDALHAVALDIELAGPAAGRAGNTRTTLTDRSEATPLTEDQRTDAIRTGAPARQWVPTVGRPIYRLRIEQASDRQLQGGYLITAEPVSNGPQAGDRCGVYFLDASGARGNRASRAVSPGDTASRTDTADTAGCWHGR